jgi:hypothetical protein
MIVKLNVSNDVALAGEQDNLLSESSVGLLAEVGLNVCRSVVGYIKALVAIAFHLWLQTDTVSSHVLQET